MINVARHRMAVERFYTDRAAIYRHGKVKDPVTKETKLIPQLVYEDQPCRISQSGLAQNNQTEAQNDISNETKLFIAPELEILQGDLLEITRGGITRKYTAGEPFPYSSHQEISIQREEWA